MHGSILSHPREKLRAEVFNHQVIFYNMDIVHFVLSIYQLMNTWRCFNFFIIMIKAVVIIQLQFVVCICVFIYVALIFEVKLLGHMLTLCLTF